MKRNVLLEKIIKISWNFIAYMNEYDSHMTWFD